MLHTAVRIKPSQRINLAWHLANAAPTGIITDEGLAWHLKHQVQCNCCPLPNEVRRELERRQIFSAPAS